MTRSIPDAGGANLAEIVAEYARRGMTAAGVCASVGLPPSAPRRLLRTDVSLGEYIRRCRMQHASEVIVTTALPLKEIAVRTGFSDPCHFSRAFRKVFGIPPKQYRRQMLSHNAKVPQLERPAAD